MNKNKLSTYHVVYKRYRPVRGYSRPHSAWSHSTSTRTTTGTHCGELNCQPVALSPTTLVLLYLSGTSRRPASVCLPTVGITGPAVQGHARRIDKRINKTRISTLVLCTFLQEVRRMKTQSNGESYFRMFHLRKHSTGFHFI
jgi:hypothetical protein